MSLVFSFLVPLGASLFSLNIAGISNKKILPVLLNREIYRYCKMRTQKYKGHISHSLSSGCSKQSVCATRLNDNTVARIKNCMKRRWHYLSILNAGPISLPRWGWARDTEKRNYSSHNSALEKYLMTHCQDFHYIWCQRLKKIFLSPRVN